MEIGSSAGSETGKTARIILIMGFNTNIAWTSMTWNPVQGCRKISEGCKNCYMFSDKKRYGQDGGDIHRSADATFFKPLAWHKQIKPETPLTDRLVFTASWSDWFIEENDQFRDEMWKVVKDTPNLIYQILTKRADRIKDCLPSDWGNGYDNVWLGVSVENQKRADERIPLLLETPAKVRFLSCEPLLERLDLVKFLHLPPCPNSNFNRYLWGNRECDCYEFRNWLHWVIVGGESGNGARKCEVRWIRSIVEQCQSANVACFVKQLGSKPTLGGTEYLRIKNKKGGAIEEFPKDLQIREMPKLWTV